MGMRSRCAPSCPTCRSDDTRPSQGQPGQSLRTLGLLEPYRCRRCLTRFWRPRRWVRSTCVFLPCALAVRTVWEELGHVGQ